MFDSVGSELHDFNLHHVILFLDCLLTEFQSIDIFKSSLIFGLQVSMKRVQTVEFRFKLESELDFLFVRSNVFVNLLLQLDAELDFFLELLSELTIVSVDIIKGQFKLLLIEIELSDLSIELILFRLHHLLVLSSDFGDKHLVI